MSMLSIDIQKSEPAHVVKSAVAVGLVLSILEVLSLATAKCFILLI